MTYCVRAPWRAEDLHETSVALSWPHTGNHEGNRTGHCNTYSTASWGLSAQTSCDLFFPLYQGAPIISQQKKKLDLKSSSFKAGECMDCSSQCLWCNDITHRTSAPAGSFLMGAMWGKGGNLKQPISLQQSVLTRTENENEAATKVSFQVSHLLAKSFTQAELIKSSSVTVVKKKKKCPETVQRKTNLF
jgi:hypothetical protein